MTRDARRMLALPPLLFAALAAIAAANGSPAQAYQLEPPTLTCTALNCSALTLVGRLNGHSSIDGVLSNAWVGQFAGRTSHCLRFDVADKTANLAMSVVGPEGAVFSNATGGSAACPDCPKVVVATSRVGVYTVVIAHQTATGLDARFTLKVGAYTAGNPNCAAATAPK